MAETVRTYEDFLAAKVPMATPRGFQIDASEVNPLLKPHQVATVVWAVMMGCAALFLAFGLGKTLCQLEIVRIILAKVGGKGLIVIPLGVRQEFMRDAEMLGIRCKFIRTIDEAFGAEIYLTNYESVRDGKLDPRHFAVCSLDEASCLRGFGGTKTFREFMALFAGDRKTMTARTLTAGVPYRFVATATPSPNEFVELLAYSAFLGAMEVSQAKTRFFKRDSTKADHLTIHPHKVREFWLWCASWALFLQRPSDLGFSDDGYELPEIDVRWHEVDVDHSLAGHDASGQALMYKPEAIGIVEAAREKRDSLDARVAKLMEIRAEDPTAHRLIWHDLEAERLAIERAIPGITSVYGAQKLELREERVIAFSEGRLQELASKPVLLGSGCNFQRHCWWAVFLGIGFKFNDFIQAIYRIQRFLQKHPVRIDLIYTAAERQVRRELERRWQQDKELRAAMAAIIKEFGLSQMTMAQTLTRAMGVKRVEVTGPGYRLVNNDCVQEARNQPDNSVGLILTSIPFSTQYEYSPNYADFGHTDTNGHFWQQMDFLIPELLRVLQPGRIAAIHVKDRVVPMGVGEFGFQTVYPFHVDAIARFTAAGFGYMGMKTIVTDVVRENNQTYRLGWSEQCKDGTKMGVGMPEYLLLFRKPPTSGERSYADVPVVKAKREWLRPGQETEAEDLTPDEERKLIDEASAQGAELIRRGRWNRPDGYSRARWQFDAHGFTRSAGDRLLSPKELHALPHDVIYKLYRQYSLDQVFDFETTVRIAEDLTQLGMLPTTFMLLQPQSWSPDVWTDVTRMLTLNGAQSAAGREMHLCPMQFDIADRVIDQMSNPGDVVLDPFGGLMTVPYRAILKRRQGLGWELSPTYFADGCGYCEAAAREMDMPSLFDLMETES